MQKKVAVFLAWAFVAIWMIVIFSLSSQQAEASNGLSKGVTEIIIDVVDRICLIDIETSSTQNWIDKLNSIVREYAHAGVFFVLAFFVIIAFRRSGLKGLNAFNVSFVLCIIYALIDEIHQIFIAGRAFELYDLALDCSGILIGLYLYNVIALIFRKIRQ